MMKKESKRFQEKLTNNEQAALDLRNLIRRSKEILKNRKRIPPEERVHYLITHAWLGLVEELSEYIDSCKRRREGHTGSLATEKKEIRHRLKNMHELGGYVEPDASIEERDEWVEQTMNFMVSRGVPWNRLKATEANLKNRGKPRSKRKILMSALGLKMEKGLTWMQIRDKLCDCEKKAHDSHCTDSIQKGVKNLKKVLGRYGISIG